MANIRELKTGDAIKYSVTIRRKGLPALSATFHDKEMAILWSKQAEDQLEMQKYFGKTEAAHSLEEAIERYAKEYLPKLRHKGTRELHLNFWKEQFKGISINDITAEKIENVLLKFSKKITVRNKKPYSPATLNRYLAALSHLYTVCVKDWKWVSQSPVAQVKRPGSTGLRLNS